MTDATATWLSDRALLRVSGEGARAFLQGLVTADLDALAPDAPSWSGLLTPQGKALFDFVLWADDDGGVLIDAEGAQIAALAQRLRLYRLRRPIEIEAAAGAVHWAVAGEGGQADPRLPALGRRWLSQAAGVAVDADWRRHRLSLGVCVI